MDKVKTSDIRTGDVFIVRMVGRYVSVSYPATDKDGRLAFDVGRVLEWNPVSGWLLLMSGTKPTLIRIANILSIEPTGSDWDWESDTNSDA